MLPLKFGGLIARPSITSRSLVSIGRVKHVLHYSSKTDANGPKQGDKSNQGKKQKKIPLWAKLKTLTTFTFSSLLVVGGVGVSGVVLYLILSELFSPSGDTQLFNRAVSMVEDNEDVRKLLQCDDSGVRRERLKAYGELATNDRWTRNRPIVSTEKVDKYGGHHHYMRFHLESKKKLGLVHIEAIESEKNYKPNFVSMYIDIPGEKRFYIIKPKLRQIMRPKTIFGFPWGSSKKD
ncbi:Mitochondrial import inner membrane translocase subunit TIM21 [Nakaseomyces bracarensis]|uniref:Mitochondrial import inner membrane translocase subunit Tim21 n=1 Tax=Nakaseomyces bracarensis TaxID=273131 RepID=A0ABR4NUW5_9SACH